MCATAIRAPRLAGPGGDHWFVSGPPLRRVLPGLPGAVAGPLLAATGQECADTNQYVDQQRDPDEHHERLKDGHVITVSDHCRAGWTAPRVRRTRRPAGSARRP